MSTSKLTIGHAEKAQQAHATNAIVALFNRQAAFFEKFRFGMMALFIMVQSCVGSIACMYILRNTDNDVLLAICASIAMGSNAVCIAQANAKVCLAAFYISVITHGILIAVTL